MFRKINSLSFKTIAACVGLFTATQLQAVSVNAQVVWANASSSTLWLNGANWGGGSAPGASQTGTFDAYPTSATTGVGIDMGGSTNNGANNQAAGAIYMSAARANNFLIGNSSTSANGTLTLNGATVNGTADVIMGNFASNASILTIQNTQGSGNKTMAIDAGSGARNITCGAGTSATAIGNTIKVNSIIRGVGSLSFLGSGSWNGTTGNAGGLLKLGAANAFSGGLNVGRGDGSQNGIVELDVTDAINNNSGNDINVYPNSELFLAAATGTYATNNLNLNLNGKGNAAALTTLGGALVTKGSVSYAWTGPINLASDAEITVLLTATLTASGNITGSGALIKNGNSNAGTLLLTGTGNSWTGGTQVGGGTLNVSAASAICAGQLAMTGLNAGVNAILSLNNAAQTITSLSSSFVPTTGTQTQNVILGAGHILTLNQSANTTYGTGAVATQTSIITGAGGLVKTGTGILTLTSSAHTFTGGLVINNGEVRFNPSATTAVGLGSCPVTLGGGRLTTIGTTTTAQVNLGTLNLSDNSTIGLGTATAHNVRFANSSAIAWAAGKMLSITNWMGGYNGTAGIKGRIYVGTTASGLTAAQLAQVQFIDGSGNAFQAMQLGSGEVVPKAPGIVTTAASYGPFYNAVPNTISVAFTATGPFASAFKVQLSNAAGVFATDTTTGIIGTGMMSPITAVLPAAMATGDNYRLRVLNGSPVTTFGSNNGSAIVVMAYPPTITSITPSRGMPGNTISITGANFGSSTTDNIVYFGATRATVTAATPTSLSVTVPAGATHAPVSLLNASLGLSAFTAAPFMPLYDTDMLTSGQVSFKSHVDFGAGAAPYIAVAGDLDGDGKADLIAVNAGSNNLSVYSNTASAGSIGTASFGSPVTLVTSYTPTNAKVADIDGDGRPDIIVVNAASATVSVFQNLSTPGAISFAPKVDFATTSAALVPLVVSIADFDGDGKPDMAVVASYSNTVAVFRNTGNTGAINSASFAAPVIFAANDGPFSITAADFDGDNKMDLAVVDTGRATVSVFRNTATPGIINAGSFAAKVDFNTGTTPIDVAAGDIDGDGKMDIIATNSTANTVSVLRNTATTGTINSGSFAAKVDFAASGRPTGVALADIDGDGKPDIAVTNLDSNSVTVLRNTATAGAITSASFASAANFSTGNAPTGITIADLDGDGKPDMATGNQTSGSISILRNYRLPNLPSVTGPETVCAGVAATYHNAVAGGTWSLVNSSLATISPSGVLTGIAGGIDTVIFSRIVSGDTAMVLTEVAIATAPDAGVISCASSVCPGSVASLTGTVVGGMWASSNPAIATVSTAGDVTGITAGAATISYVVTNSCGSTAATAGLTVLPLPVAPAAITGNTTITLIGSTSMLVDSTAGGTWASSNTAVATVSNTGTVTTVAGGYATITYSVAQACGTMYATANIRSISVNHAPVFTIGTTYNLTICDNAGINSMNARLKVRDIDTGQTLIWSLVTAPAHGNANVSYRATSTGDIIAPVNLEYTANTGFTGRDTFLVRVTDGVTATTIPFRVQVNPSPAIPVITGAPSVCTSVSDTLTGIPSGGVFSDTSAIIAVSAAGILRGSAEGLGFAIYTSPANAYGCTSKGYYGVHVVAPMPATAITGATTVCPAASITLSNRFVGGTWASTNSAIAAAHDSIISGVSPGAATISYTLVNVCGTRVATKAITVTATTMPGAITGSAAPLCPGVSALYSNSRAGGAWSVTNPSLATVSATGVVTGIAGGLDTIKYSYTNTCGQVGVVTRAVALSNSPVVGTITGPSVLVRGAYGSFANSISGGVWSSVFTAKATINSLGAAHAVAAGIDTIKYTVTNTCGRAVAVQVLTITSSRDGEGGEMAGSDEAGISIFPNPNAGAFTLELPDGYMGATIVLADMNGKVVETRTASGLQQAFNLGGFAKGIYLLTVSSEGNKWCRKVVVE